MSNLLTGLYARVLSVPASRALRYLVVAVALLVVVTWLLNTPPGLLGKADAIGYAFCHRIEHRSFHIGDRPFPLCARCTGMYLGALLGMVGMHLMGRGRAASMPTRWLMVVLVGFMGLMGIDGINSYSHFFPGLPHLYEPQNWLRLVTGMGTGLALAALILPVFNQTVWRDWEARPVLGRFRELALLVGAAAAVVVALVVSDNVLVLYPLAVLSAAGVLALVVALNTTILLMAIRREARAPSWRAAWLPLTAGVAMAIAEIGAIDAVRFAIFGTWGGMPLPG